MERAQMDRELLALRELIERMARVAVAAIEASMQAFIDRRHDLVDDVHEAERTLNELQMSLDDHALRLIALRQPAAGDLRLILAAIRANVDVERLGDHAVNLAHLSMALADRPSNPVEGTVVGMAEIALGMVRDAVTAFLGGDGALARAVLERDDVQDHEFESVFPVVIAQMRENPLTADAGVRLLLVARNLERIADHATNIAEQAIFLAEARDVRHGSGDARTPPGS